VPLLDDLRLTSRHEHPSLDIVLVDQPLTDGVSAPPFRLYELEVVRREDLQQFQVSSSPYRLDSNSPSCAPTHSLIGIHDILRGNLPPHLLRIHRALLSVEHVDLGIKTDHRLVVDIVLTGEHVGGSLTASQN
jgi:hypothetical protein